MGLGLLLVGVAWTTNARAQVQPAANPVLSAYHEYQAAKRRGDNVAAETHAGRALAESERRDGPGGATAVLAMNLAIVRMDIGRAADSIAPARRALELAQAGAKGVDPLAARLIIGEAELSVDPKADEASLLAALHEADAHGPDIDVYAFPAAVMLGEVALKTSRPSNALTAWRSALRHIAGAPGDPNTARAQTLVGEGVALVATHSDHSARITFDDAVNTMQPMAPESADGEHISVAELTLANAMAWLATVKAREDSESSPDSRGDQSRRAQLPGRPAMCPGSIEPVRLPKFPKEALDDVYVGAAVVRVRTDDKGEVLGAVVVATAPNDLFRQALMDPTIRWVYRRSKDTPPGCRLDSQDYLKTIRFVIG
jgi:hypothetical protein